MSIERTEKTRAVEIGAHDADDLGGDAALAAAEIGDRDGQRLHVALGDDDAQGILRRGGRKRRDGRCGDHRRAQEAESGCQHGGLLES